MLIKCSGTQMYHIGMLGELNYKNKATASPSFKSIHIHPYLLHSYNNRRGIFPPVFFAHWSLYPRLFPSLLLSQILSTAI